MKNISTENIHIRFKEAMNKLSECDEDVQHVRETLGESNWNRFTSHTSGFIISSLLSSDPVQGS